MDQSKIDKINSRLLTAAFMGDKEEVESLLKIGADIDAVLEDGVTALMYAAKEGEKEIVELLLEKGANVDLINYHGLAALDLARNTGNNEIVELIKEAKIKQDKKEENAFSAMIDIYIMYRNGEMSEDMLEKMNNIDINWIEHCESELTKLGIEYYQMKNTNK